MTESNQQPRAGEPPVQGNQTGSFRTKGFLQLHELRERLASEEPKEYIIDSPMAVSVQRKAPYATAPAALKVAYVLVLIAVAVGVWVATERAELPQWAQLVLPALAVAGARSAMRLAYALRMVAKYRKELAALTERLGQVSTGTGN